MRYPVAAETLFQASTASAATAPVLGVRIDRVTRIVRKTGGLLRIERA
jgi:hypothetical protein